MEEGPSTQYADAYGICGEGHDESSDTYWKTTTGGEWYGFGLALGQIDRSAF